MTFSETDLLLRLLCGSDGESILVDVGAHVGSFSAAFARRGWRVIAFEPEPSNYREFSVNLASFPKVTCVQKAVSDQQGTKVPFYVSSEHWGIHSLKPFHPSHQPECAVETVRLDEALRELGFDAVTLLKVDIEGADLLALKGFDFVHLRPKAVMCEFMDQRTISNFGYSYHDMVKHMAAFEYVAYVVEWSPVTEYGRRGFLTQEPQFLGCRSYPLDHEPSWGNLIFVPAAEQSGFARVLDAYLGELRQHEAKERWKERLKRIAAACGLRRA